MGQIGAATMFASPIAGCWLLASNLSELGMHEARRWAVTVGLALFAVLFLLPEAVPEYLVYLVNVGLIQYLASRLHGDELERHLETGQKQSSWKVAGICAVVTGVVLVVIFSIVLLFVPDPVVNVSENDEIFYWGDATEEDAVYLGEVLTELNLLPTFTGSTTEIELTSGEFAVSFVLVEGAWTDPETLDFYTQVGNFLADLPRFGRPLAIHLTDEFLEPQETLRID
jgi:hypothetical protein